MVACCGFVIPAKPVPAQAGSGNPVDNAFPEHPPDVIPIVYFFLACGPSYLYFCPLRIKPGYPPSPLSKIPVTGAGEDRDDGDNDL